MGQHSTARRPTGWLGIFERVARRARIHHIYWLLASFDLAAVGTGLYLSHHLNALLAGNMATSVEWGALQKDISILRRAAAAATAPGNDVFVTGDLDSELKSWDARSAELEGQVVTLKSHVLEGLSPLEQADVGERIAALEQAFESLAVTGTQLFDLYRRGQTEASAPAMALMNRQSSQLIASIDDLSSYLHETHVARQMSEAASAGTMQKLEFLVAGMMALMVLAVTVFGHWIGQQFQRQYVELDRAHAAQRDLVAQLQASHVDIVSLNAELNGLNQGLEARVADRTCDLVNANAAITDLNRELEGSIAELKDAQDEIVRRGRMAQLGQLTATVAHEIRNPLSAIRTSAYFIERRLAGQNAGIEKPLARINGAIQRCDTIITQLMDFMSNRELVTKAVLLDEWVAACVSQVKAQLSDQIDVVLVLGATGAVVEIDPDRMRRLLLNLLVNANEAMLGTGEYLRTCEGERPTIWVETATRGGEATIRVRDNGPGIPPQNLNLVLEPLFTTKSFGVGLGLPAAEQILYLHGGRLAIESSPGIGTLVTASFKCRGAGLRAA